MSPVALSSAPDQAELALHSLVLLLAAASWSLNGSAGEVRVEEMPSTPEAFLGFSVACAKDLSQGDCVALAAKLSEKVKELIEQSAVDLVVLPKQEALQLLAENFPKCSDFAHSIDSSSLGLHVVRLPGH